MLQLRQCPACGAYFLYWSDFGYRTCGTVDDAFQTRQSEEALKRPLSTLTSPKEIGPGLPDE